MTDRNDILRSTILVTGGTGSFGRALVKFLLKEKNFRGTIRVYSRDEFKQYQLQQEYPDDLRLRFFIGDIRDKDRLERAMSGVDVVVHAAALKHITIAEYNPFEVVKTNVFGSQNVVEAALDADVKKSLLISSDKAVHPINLYGATKMVAEKLFIQGNVYAGSKKNFFSVARYGNVLGSRGSVVPLFLKQKPSGDITITHPEMTRFWITLPQAAGFVYDCLKVIRGGEVFVPKLPSLKIMDLAKIISPGAKIRTVGIRPGEKLHEELITQEESARCIERKDRFEIIPIIPHWSTKQLKDPKYRKNISHRTFWYQSHTNNWWLTESEIKREMNRYLKDVETGYY